MNSLKTPTEIEVGKNLEDIFVRCPDNIETKLKNFPKYVRRQDLKRFLALYEIFKMIVLIKGSIVECGVYQGSSLLAWAKLSAILEPENLTRRIYGFDSFEGFPSVHSYDRKGDGAAELGEFGTNSYEEITQLIREYDRDRFLGHIPKVELIRGDATQTIPAFLEHHEHLLISLLFVDFDLYEPTRAALEHFLPRMPRGAVLVFDELDNPRWPGETRALLDSLSMNRLKIQRIQWDPYIGYAVLD